MGTLQNFPHLILTVKSTIPRYHSGPIFEIFSTYIIALKDNRVMFALQQNNAKRF